MTRPTARRSFESNSLGCFEMFAYFCSSAIFNTEVKSFIWLLFLLNFTLFFYEQILLDRAVCTEINETILLIVFRFIFLPFWLIRGRLGVLGITD